MITRENYNDRIESIDLENFPDAAQDIKTGIEFIQKLEPEGIDWKNSPQNSPIGRAVDSLIKILNQKPSTEKKPPSQSLNGLGAKNNNTTNRRGRKKRPFKTESEFIADYIALHDKTRSRSQVEKLLDEIQEAIKSGKIRKNNLFAKDTMYIQRRLIALANDMTKTEKRKLKIADKVLADFGEVVSWNGRIPGEILLEKFLDLQKSIPTPAKVRDLKSHISINFECKRIRGKYVQPLKSALGILKTFKPGKKLKAKAKATSLVNQALGFTNSDKSLANIQANKNTEPIGFRTDQLPDNSHLQIPLTGKWDDLFNQPTKGFAAMVYGKPKQGKSTLVLEFCGYLVRAGLGNVLWVELEEDIETTFKEKVDRLQVGHPDFRAWPEIPRSLADFDFVVINSVSEGKITPDQIRELKKQNKGVSFVLIYHTRKDGEFAGGQEHAHLVDVLVEVKNGRAFAKGRFGNGETVLRFNAKKDKKSKIA